MSNHCCECQPYFCKGESNPFGIHNYILCQLHADRVLDRVVASERTKDPAKASPPTPPYTVELEDWLRTVRDSGALDDNNGGEDWQYSDQKIAQAKAALIDLVEGQVVAGRTDEVKRIPVSEDEHGFPIDQIIPIYQANRIAELKSKGVNK